MVNQKNLSKVKVRQKLDMVWDLLHNFEGHVEASANAVKEIREGKVVVELLLTAVDQGVIDLGYILRRLA